MRPSNKDVIDHQNLMNQAIAGLRCYPNNQFSGRGVVICGGGERYFPSVWVCVRMLRHWGCQLPIELWYLGSNEVNNEIVELLAPYNVTCINAYERARTTDIQHLGGWELKPFAIINSRFEEVLLVDADNVAVGNPEYLFDTQTFSELGSIFWPDRYTRNRQRAWLRPEVWSICEMPNLAGVEFESGQLFVNKSKAGCWQALQLCMYLNAHSNFYYHFFYGDKDTFQIAWRKLGLPFGWVPHLPHDLHEDWTIVQFDFDGKRLFQHRSGAKWSLNGPNRKVPDFHFEQECIRFLDDLRLVWSGKIRQLPEDFNAPESQIFDSICDTQDFRSTIPYHSDEVLSLMPDFEIQMGHRGGVGHWTIGTGYDQKVMLRLSIILDYSSSCTLLLNDNHIWHGYWNQFEDIEAKLEPWQHKSIV